MAKATAVIKEKDILLIMTEKEAKLVRAMLSKLSMFPDFYGNETNSLRKALDDQGVTVMSYDIGLEGNLYFDPDKAKS